MDGWGGMGWRVSGAETVKGGNSRNVNKENIKEKEREEKKKWDRELENS